LADGQIVKEMRLRGVVGTTDAAALSGLLTPWCGIPKATAAPRG